MMASTSSPSLLDLYEETRARISPSLTAISYENGHTSQDMTYEELHRQMTALANLLLPVASRRLIVCFCRKDILTLSLILGILKARSAFLMINVERNSGLLMEVSSDYVSTSANEKSTPDTHQYGKEINVYQKPVTDFSNYYNDQLWSTSKFVPIGAVIVEDSAADVCNFQLCLCWMLYDEICLSDKKLKIYLLSENCCSIHHGSCNFHKWDDLTCNENLAFVARTTGTTGHPKIVQVPHSCIVPNITHLKSLYSLTTNDIILLSVPMTFDPSIVLIFLAVAAGATLVVIPDHITRIPRAFTDIILSRKVTLIQVCPFLLMSLGTTYVRDSLLAENTPLRILSLGGERCPSIEKLEAIRNPKCRTRIFTLYGPTEVSCWATYKEINFNDEKSSSEISLGSPLAETDVYVCNDNNEPIEEGFGQLFVGSSTRYCIINDEVENECRKPRATGDWVYRTKDGEIFYDCRKDRVIKSFGQKIPLSLLDNALDSLSFIKNHVITIKEPVLCIFVVLDAECGYSKNDANLLIQKNLQKSSKFLPVFEIIFVPYIPVNRHGKADQRKLLDYFQSKTGSKVTLEQNRGKKLLNKADILKIVSSLWKDHTLVHSISGNDNYVMNGGNSISALQFVSEIEHLMHEMFPTLVDKLLTKTFNEVMDVILAVVQTDNTQHKSRKVQDSAESDHKLKTPDSQKNNLNLPQHNPISKKLCHIGVTRRGYQESCFCGNCNFENIAQTNFDRDSVLVTTLKHDLKKCIDGSVCATYYTRFNSVHFFIGSHSGQFASVSTEKVLWEVTLPNRIESSACLSSCGLFVLVGCYDKHLYCFNALTGAIAWKIETGAEVKSSPVVTEKNIAYVGSNDKNLYAVHVETGSVLWKKQIGNGSIFSSPAACLRFVCAASLDGIIAALDPASGDVIWRSDYGKPFFSSPLITESYVYIGCVDDNVLQFDLFGNVVRKYSTGGPVFSSPAIFSLANQDKAVENIVVGSHNSKLVCFSTDGNLLWTYKCDSPVYSSPLPFKGKGGRTYIIATCISGRLFILDSESGSEIYTFNFQGEIFSSAMVLKDSIAVGCRDNNIYVFKI